MEDARMARNEEYEFLSFVKENIDDVSKMEEINAAERIDELAKLRINEGIFKYEQIKVMNDEIKRRQVEKEKYKKEFEIICEEIKELRSVLEQVKNSLWVNN